MRHSGGMILICLGIACARPLSAQEIVLDSFSGLGARAMGMGGAYTALSDDFSGLFWNPAGLARIKEGEVNAALSYQNSRNRTRYFGTPAADQLSSLRLNAIGVTYPYTVYRGSLVFGGGYGQTGSFDTGLSIDGYDTISRFQKSGVSRDRGGLGAFVLGGAIDVAPKLSLGLALQVWLGRNQFQKELTLQDTKDAHGDTIRLYQRIASRDRYTAWGARGGVLYVHPSGIRIGATISSPVTFRIASELEDEYEDALEGATEHYPADEFSDRYSLRHPIAFDLGAAWSARRLTVAADLHYADLRQATHVDQPEVIAPDVDDFREQYRNTFRYHLGAEYRHVVTGLAFRTGYYRDPIRYVGGGSLPEVQVKEDRDVLMFGLGSRLVKIVYLDLAVAVGGYRQMAGNREDHVRTVRAFASVGYRF